MTLQKPESPLAADLLYGAEEIGEYIKRTPKQVYEGYAAGHLPLEKLGRILVGSKERLKRKLTGESAA
jgi:hypothetical protein